MPNSNDFDKAMVLANEYRRENERGDVARAEQIRKTIEDLVGDFSKSGKFYIPLQVRIAMGIE